MAMLGKRRTRGAYVVVVLVAALPAISSGRAQEPVTANGPPPYEELVDIASELNSALPMMVGARTEWFQATALPPSTFAYHYRLVTVTATPDSLDRLASILQQQKPGTVNMACTSPEVWTDFLSRGVTMRFSYYDKDRMFFASFDVTPADCVEVRVGPVRQ